jgi:hypothetical protein
VPKKQVRTNLEWFSADLHIHTPASSDYQQPEVAFLDILQKAESRGLDIIAITDHNTTAGYRKMREEMEELELLEKLNRLLPEEKSRLFEYRRLNQKLLVLPGFEFTATFGFHILGIFPPNKPIRELEHLLISLNIPANLLDEGSQVVGATTDVLTAYQLINQAGGLVIAAHANSSNGVAMRGFNFGGQTKIAYTQDLNLHALEVTDLDQKGKHTTATFFNGTKPEYPRRMHCIQGSDCHRLAQDLLRKKNLALGERPTDLYLPQPTFDAILELFNSNDFSRTRPQRHKEEPVYDFIQVAIEEGPNIVQYFHDSISTRGGKLFSVLTDICAFANTNGGTLYIGLSPDLRQPPLGITIPETSITQLEKEINSRISPPISCTVDIHDFKGKKIMRVLIPRGDDPPYALDDNKIYVRNETDTELAVRDEIVGLVLRGKHSLNVKTEPPVVAETPAAVGAMPPVPADLTIPPPRTGVEVVSYEDRDKTRYYTVRDLRNGNVVKNVTISSARRLWHYAISRFNDLVREIPASILWQNEIGLIKRYKQGNTTLYDFINHNGNGYRYFFGVTSNGIHGPWKVFGEEDES